MSTRTNIVIEYGSSRVFIYRHFDGYPSCTGADLAEKLAEHKTAGAFVKALLTQPRDGDDPKPQYELTSEIHGDIEYLCRVKFDRWHDGGFSKIGVLKVDGPENVRASDVKLGNRESFVRFVNAEIRAQNERISTYAEATGRDFEPQAEVA